MGNNLHISYDLNSPGQNYDAVAEAIKSLGSWAKVHQSFWYVNSNYTAEQARNILNKVIDANDTLYVVDATNNKASWHNLSDKVSKHVKSYWLK